MDVSTLSDIIGNDSYWQVNKKIARYFKDNNTAVLLSDFISKQKYFGDRNELQSFGDPISSQYDGYFFNTSENIEKDCNISYHKQKSCINQLKDVGFIETIVKGLPGKLHFKINSNNIWNFLNSSIEKNQILELEKFELNNNKLNKNKINNVLLEKEPKGDVLKNSENSENSEFENLKKQNEILLKKLEEEKRKKVAPKKEKAFLKPTIEEIEEYCKSRSNGISGFDFFNFYESKGWMIGKNKMKDWKAAVRTWENNRKKQENGTTQSSSSGQKQPYFFDRERAMQTLVIENTGGFPKD